MEQTDYMDVTLFELPDTELDDERVGEVIAEKAHSMALDNGSDMLGVNPEEHAEEEWDGYLEHALEMYADYSETAVDNQQIDTLRGHATAYWSEE